MTALGTTQPPVFALTGAKLDELELLAGGLLSPADGYCLPSEVPEHWPAPFVLAVPAAVGHEALAHGTLFLSDPDGTALAALKIDRAEDTRDHKAVCLAGTVTALGKAEHPPARHLRIARPLFPAVPAVVAAFSEAPRPWQLAAAMTAALDAGAVLWLVAVCGPQPHGRYTVSPLVEELEAAAAEIPGARAGLVVLPVELAAASPVDRILHEHVLGRLGAGRVLDFVVHDAHSGDAGPFNPFGPRAGAVVLFTGLSGSGKSTVARALAERLQNAARVPVTLLDGDDVRRILSPGLGFSVEERNANVRRIGWVAALISGAGGIAICAPIAPFDVTRQQVRHMAQDNGRFLLVHISTPLSECEARDRKGLYAKARRGELKEFTGIDSPYEYPRDADLHLDTSRISVAEAVDRVLQELLEPGLPANAAAAPTPRTGSREALPGR
ncbi:adenylyl-sulfate kinase [Arthrobacter sp.]|uniref:adenylyl-sulfate kinase n=1 Tax=Arthrobacter sp. TaxID=1667 RepID=UPI002587AA6F|nr:adenylyl-sulfate kinase [Arthrobacter sp.]